MSIHFKNRDHERFYQQCLVRCGCGDPYHKAFFYTMGISDETRKHVDDVFDFQEDVIRPEGLNKGCFGGHSDRECPCVQQDDMNRIYPAVRDCDVIVLASPLYYWTMSGQLRTAFDRLFALEEGGKNLLRGNGKSSALLMAAEGHGFDDAVLYYDHLMNTCIGKTLVMFWPEAIWMWVTSKANRNSNRPMSLANPFKFFSGIVLW